MMELVELNLRQLPNRTHSLMEALAAQHAFQHQEGGQTAEILSVCLEGLRGQASLLDWLNVFLFNVCARNEEDAAANDDQLLQSTGDHQSSPMPKQTETIGSLIRGRLKQWLLCVLSSSFVQRVVTEAVEGEVGRQRALRWLLETIDYLQLKYALEWPQQRRVVRLLESAQSHSNSFLHDRAAMAVQRLMNSGQTLGELLQQQEVNGLSLALLAEVLSAAYFNLSPPRKLLEQARCSGRRIVEELIDYIIRKVGKAELFSQRMQTYRPYELLSAVLFQRQAGSLLCCADLIDRLSSRSPSSLYSTSNHSQLVAFSSLLTLTIPQQYPQLHCMLRYMHSALQSKHGSADGLQLLKKFLLNRWLLNPHYYALLRAPNEVQMENFVKTANQLRLLFYANKLQQSQDLAGYPRIMEVAQLFGQALMQMLAAKPVAADRHSKDRGVYLNDKILGHVLCELGDQLRGDRQQDRIHSNLHTDSSLSFSLRNDSLRLPTHPSIPTHPSLSGNPSVLPVPSIPKPKQPQSTQRSQEGSSSRVSRDGLSGVEQVEELIVLRRQYGELRREVQGRKRGRKERRENWQLKVQLLGQNALNLRTEIAKTTNQLLLHSILF